MGGWIYLGICISAAVILYGTGHPILFTFAIIISIMVFWSFGVMHNYAMESAKSRFDRLKENMTFEGRSKEAIDRLDKMIIRPNGFDIERVPNWIAYINMASSVIGIILFISGVIIRFV